MSLRRLGLLAGLLICITLGWFFIKTPTLSPHASAELPNFLVIDIDTLAISRIGRPQAGGSLTPNLDRLAQEGVRFSQAYSSSGWTVPALFSILSGRWPVPIEIEGGAIPKAPDRDLPRIFSIYGYHTVAVWGSTLVGAVNAAISPSFKTVLPSHPGPQGQDVQHYLENTPTEPFFLYVHDVDLHSPGQGPGMHQGWRGLYAAAGGGAAGEAAVLDRYDSNLHTYDTTIGKTLDILDKTGLAARTVVVLISDHGQDFFDHAFVDHGVLYDTTLHVPLIIRDPQGPQGKTIDQLVQTLDLGPTLLSRAKIPLDAEMRGQSLLPLMGGDGLYASRPVYSLSERCHVSLRDSTHKLILRDGRPRPDRSWKATGGSNEVRVSLGAFMTAHAITLPPPDCQGANAATLEDLMLEFYDVVADPGETYNLIAEQADAAVPMVNALLAYMAMSTGSTETQPLSDAQIETIKQQGYWGMMHAEDQTTP